MGRRPIKAPTQEVKAPVEAAEDKNLPVTPDAQTDEKNMQPDVSGTFVVTRVLKVAKPLMKGGDVEAVQRALIAVGLGCGAGGANGVYSAETAAAVRHFQSMNRLIVSGKVDKFTALAMGAEWEDPKPII